MEPVLKSFVERLDDIFARDLIYVCAGALVAASVLHAMGVFGDLQLSSIEFFKSWIFFVLIAPLLHITGYCTREFVGLIGLVTTKELDPKKLKLVDGSTLTPASVFFIFNITNFYRVPSGANGAVGDSSALFDTGFDGDKSGNRQYQIYKRAIFLKEILSTMGCACLMSSVILFVGWLSDHLRIERSGDAANFLTWVSLFSLGFFATRFSVYNAFRQGNIANDLALKMRDTKLAEHDGEAKHE